MVEEKEVERKRKLGTHPGGKRTRGKDLVQLKDRNR